jgi:putative membrane protein
MKMNTQPIRDKETVNASEARAASGSASANELAKQRTSMALIRTRIAADRTLMAWIRTGLSMISFGFTIYKFLQYMRNSEKGPEIPILHGPRNLGMALIALGTSALIVASIQYWQLLKGLQPGKKNWEIWSWSLTVAVAISILGVVTFASVLWRMGPF